MNIVKRLGWFVLMVLFAAYSFGAPAEETTADQSKESTAKKEQKKKDFGEASMLLGEVEWFATSARAKMKNTTLIISASRMDGSASTKMVRQQIELNIKDFAGPGTYEAARGSMFVVVGLNVEAAEEGEMDQALVDTLTKAKTKFLHGARVVIKSADDKQIMGSFTHELTDPKITKGIFRALVKKKK